MKPYIKLGDRYSNRDKEVTIANSVVLDPVGALAVQLIERWGLMFGRYEGEDSAGRAMTKPEEVETVVHRAFDMASAVYLTAETRGHIVKLPNPFEEESEE